jgi:hypothetical protein
MKGAGVYKSGFGACDSAAGRVLDAVFRGEPGFGAGFADGRL